MKSRNSNARNEAVIDRMAARHKCGSLLTCVVFGLFVNVGYSATDLSEFFQAFHTSKNEMQYALDGIVYVFQSNLDSLEPPANQVVKITGGAIKSLQFLDSVRDQNRKFITQLQNDSTNQVAAAELDSLEDAIETHFDSTPALGEQFSSAGQSFRNNVAAGQKLLKSIKEQRNYWLSDRASLVHTLRDLVAAKQASLQANKALRLCYVTAQAILLHNSTVATKVSETFGRLPKELAAESPNSSTILGWSQPLAPNVIGILQTNSALASLIDGNLKLLLEQRASFDKTVDDLDKWYLHLTSPYTP
jgi:hypothetical protein